MLHNDASPEWLELVREKVQSLQYGVVQIVVHDSKVTQIERTEKTRLKGDSGPRANEFTNQTTGVREQ